MALYFYVNHLYHMDESALAIEILSDRIGIVRSRDHLVELYARILTYANKGYDARSYISQFFESYDGDLWSSPGFSERQKVAIEREIPSVLIATLPKSGTDFILRTLVSGLDTPHCGLNPVGMSSDLIPSRVHKFALGGAVATCHLRPSPKQIELLEAAGVRKLILHIRDPRQAALSMVHHTVSSQVTHRPAFRIASTRRDIQRALICLKGTMSQISYSLQIFSKSGSNLSLKRKVQLK